MRMRIVKCDWFPVLHILVGQLIRLALPYRYHDHRRHRQGVMVEGMDTLTLGEEESALKYDGVD